MTELNLSFLKTISREQRLGPLAGAASQQSAVVRTGIVCLTSEPAAEKFCLIIRRFE